MYIYVRVYIWYNTIHNPDRRRTHVRGNKLMHTHTNTEVRPLPLRKQLPRASHMCTTKQHHQYGETPNTVGTLAQKGTPHSELPINALLASAHRHTAQHLLHIHTRSQTHAHTIRPRGKCSARLRRH